MLLVSKLIQTPQPAITQWRRSGVVIVNVEHILHLALVFQLLTLRRYSDDH